MVLWATFPRRGSTSIGRRKPTAPLSVVIAGGGYAHISVGVESTPTSGWLQSIGVTAFELIYRLPGEGWSRDAPFQDGQRAMRLVRSLAPSYGVDPARIGLDRLLRGRASRGHAGRQSGQGVLRSHRRRRRELGAAEFLRADLSDAQHDGRRAFAARSSERIRAHPRERPIPSSAMSAQTRLRCSSPKPPTTPFVPSTTAS